MAISGTEGFLQGLFISMAESSKEQKSCLSRRHIENNFVTEVVLRLSLSSHQARGTNRHFPVQDGVILLK